MKFLNEALCILALIIVLTTLVFTGVCKGASLDLGWDQSPTTLEGTPCGVNLYLSEPGGDAHQFGPFDLGPDDGAATYESENLVPGADYCAVVKSYLLANPALESLTDSNQICFTVAEVVPEPVVVIELPEIEIPAPPVSIILNFTTPN